MKHEWPGMTGLAAGALVLMAGVVYGQVAASHPAFDAASVKVSGDERFIPMVSGRMQGGPGTGSPGRIDYVQVELPQLLMKAWDLRGYQLIGPAWFKKFDKAAIYTIRATLPPDTTKQQFQLMLQDLLVRRFRMESHRETRKVVGYDLVVAPGGPKLKEAADTSEPATGPPSGLGKDGFGLLPPGHGATVVLSNGTHAKFQSYTMAELVETYLRSFVQEAVGDELAGPIRDKTGLTGKYDFTLVFDSRGGQVVRGPAMRTATPPRAVSGVELPGGDLNGLPDIFNAVESSSG